MAQYRGTIQGGRGQASRLGTKNSGLEVDGVGWNIGADLDLRYDSENDRTFWKSW